MGKLVRDKIPGIIRASGRTPRVTTLAAGAYRIALYDKLREEVDELIAARTADAVIEEAADILDVLTAIAAEHGVTLDGILDAAQRKRAEAGGFAMRLCLDSVDPRSSAGLGNGFPRCGERTSRFSAHDSSCDRNTG